MSQTGVYRLRVEKDVVTRVARVLKGTGNISVRVGQQVTPEEIIGTGMVSSGFRILNLAAQLSVSPKESEKYLKRNLGQKIYRGELLAFKEGGLFAGKKVVIAPVDGVLEFLNSKTGELRISLLPQQVSLPAGVYGIVENIDADKGQVVIRTQVSRIHGVLGSGRSRDGILHVLGKNNDLISAAAIEEKYGGHILVGGSLFFKQAISVSISTGVVGIVTGGINSDDYKGMSGGRLVFPKKLDSDIGISVVACEGFGAVPIGLDIFEILSAYEGKFVFIDGNKASINLPSFSSSSLVKVKNAQLPPVQANSLTGKCDYTRGIGELKVGVRVRVIGTFYLGEQGKLLAIDNGLTLLPSKIKASLATVETPTRKIQVPVANLEVIM